MSEEKFPKITKHHFKYQEKKDKPDPLEEPEYINLNYLFNIYNKKLDIQKGDRLSLIPDYKRWPGLEFSETSYQLYKKMLNIDSDEDSEDEDVDATYESLDGLMNGNDKYFIDLEQNSTLFEILMLYMECIKETTLDEIEDDPTIYDFYSKYAGDDCCEFQFDGEIRKINDCWFISFF